MDDARRALYDDVAAFCADVPRDGTVVVGITGPQGCGKSTLADAVVGLLGERGLRAAAVSVDDFYLTHAEQRDLAARHPDNPYLRHRGYPGTHDVALGTAVLDALRAPGWGDVAVPVYNKGAWDGRGDRAPQPRTVPTPLDVVLLEGWFLGFQPVAAVPDVRLGVVNALLAGYAAWLTRLGALVHLDAVDPTSVVRWRVDAERSRREATGTGLSDADARAYVDLFLPAYATYVPSLRARPPIAGPVLRVPLGEDRLPAR